MSTGLDGGKAKCCTRITSKRKEKGKKVKMVDVFEGEEKLINDSYCDNHKTVITFMLYFVEVYC